MSPARAATPMMQQYGALKQAYDDCLLFFRLGDFYELFAEDAVTAARELEITLTSREAGQGERLPMCGVPHHASQQYIERLVEKGYKVAVCEQLEDPKQAKGVVRRDVVRVITPGTVIEGRALESKANRYLVAVVGGKDGYGLAACDLSTGEFRCTRVTGRSAKSRLIDEVERLRPPEILLAPGVEGETDLLQALRSVAARCRTYDAAGFAADEAVRMLCDHFGVDTLGGFGLDGMESAVQAAGGVLSYLQQTQKSGLKHLTRIVPYDTSGAMVVDAVTRRNLELVERIGDGRRNGTLLAVLDDTVTGMGGRLLRQWIERPLVDLDEICRRQAAVGRLREDSMLRSRLREALDGVYDIERLIGRVAYGTANARDLVSMRVSFEQLPGIRAALAGESEGSPLADVAAAIDPLDDVGADITAVVVDDPPASLTEGGLIRDGFHPEVDRLRAAQREGKDWIAALEVRERERTGIKSLKVGFNKVFGYYIEVTRANLDAVPDSYERKQTLAGGERYVTAELKEKEAAILGSEERVIALEYELFTELRTRVAAAIERVQQTAAKLAELDVFASLAEVAAERGYCRPEVRQSGGIHIRDGRHPVVEASLAGGGFVPNDLALEPDDNRLLILTGPNMAGKSTYLRQVALIVLMAQVGSFVPAKSAKVGAVDRIFTRVGASDDLATGRSTFMVEMVETGVICHNATDRSLVLIDELGRGTSTYDGVALAQAVAEHLHDEVRALTIMSTHYHELTGLEERLDGCKNLRVDVAESRGRIRFLYRVVEGRADRSYGINVARMAGLPAPILRRAARVLSALERTREGRTGGDQLNFLDAFLTEEAAASSAQASAAGTVVDAIRNLDLNALTPLAALNLLERFRRELEA